jgi:hypothetical protein
MATKSTSTTTALILATFALVGLMTAGVSQTVFAQSVDPLGALLGEDAQADGTTDSSGITDEAETTDDTQDQATSQDETNTQSNSIDQDQTAAINEEIGTGSGSEVASASSSDSASDSESTYKTKYKEKDGSGSTPSSYPGTSTSSSDSASDSDSGVSNNGTIGQDQSLDSPVQVNTNNAGDDESRSAVVGFDLGFEQFTDQDSSIPGTGTSVPIIVIPDRGT